MLPQGPAGQRCGRLRRPSKRQDQALRALRGLAFSPARLRPYLPPRRCSGAQSGPVRWWPCCAPSAPPFARFTHRAKGGRSRPVPLALRSAGRAAGTPRVTLTPSRGPGPPGLRAGRRCGAAIETPPAYGRGPSWAAAFSAFGGRRKGAVWAAARHMQARSTRQHFADLGAVGPQPPTMLTGQPPLCAWPSGAFLPRPPFDGSVHPPEHRAE